MIKQIHPEAVPNPAPRSNRLLGALPEHEFEQLRPCLQYASLSLGDVLHEPNELIEQAYFPTVGLLSRLAVMEDGQQVEVGLIGNEGFIGGQIILGSPRSSWRTVVQCVPTVVFSLKSDNLRKAFHELPAFQGLVLRHMRAQTAIVTQIAACNCIHDGEKRTARWLLMCQDRLGSDVLPLTQEFLAQMLGVQRTTITLIAGNLHDAGLISCSRGKITVLDRRGLEAAACECYALVHQQHLSLLQNP